MSELGTRPFVEDDPAGGDVVAAAVMLDVPQIFTGTDTKESSSDPTAIVIGSGFGGSVAALRLGYAGIQTLILERGQHYQYSPTRKIFGSEKEPNSQMFWFQECTTVWPLVTPKRIKRVPGMMEVIQQPPNVTPGNVTIGCGAAVGGGSIHYDGCTVQPPQRYFEALWPSEVSYTELDRIYYPLVRSMLATSTIPPDIYHSDPYTYSRAFDQEMAAAGYPTTPAPSDFNWGKVRAELARFLRRSAVIGECQFGNSDGAKNDLTQTYLPLALATGRVFIHPLTEVTSITTRPGGGYLLEATQWTPDGNRAGTKQFGCDLLFLAAGSIGTTKLLVTARDTGALPNLNGNIGKNWGTNGDAIAVRDYFGPAGKTNGAGFASTAFVPSGFGIPIRVESASNIFFNGSSHLVQFSVAVDMENRGTWTYDASSRAVVLKDWTADKNAPAEQAAQAFNQMIIDRQLATPPVDLPRIRMSGLTVHPVGGCELGKATDLFGRVCGYQGLYAVDGSIVPGNIGGANPSLTIAAMAERSLANIISLGG